MVQNGFQIFITMDKNLQHQQNVRKFPITVFVLKARNNKHQTIQPYIAKVTKLLQMELHNGIIEVNL